MGRTAGRSADQTRRQILDATASVVRHRGVGATLDEIAEAAGLSKGGLIYHFASKDALLLGLTSTLLEDFRTAVHTAVEPGDDAPGRLTRAYLRVGLDPEVDDRTRRDNLVLLAQLVTDEQVAELAAADNRRWEAELGADRLPPAVLDLVLAAADGAGLAAVWGGSIDRSALTGLRDRLMMITRDQRLWAALTASAQ